MEKKLFSRMEKISLKDVPNFSEFKLQEYIVSDPTVLGLGELDVIREQKLQSTGGRLDLLMVSSDEDETRYVIEIQLGKTDPSHIIRTIEYWDNEKKRYKDYQHVAVLVAEDITNRFFNVISLLNGAVQIIAIQVNAYKYNDNYFLVFTKILDMPNPNIPEMESNSTPADRIYWEKKGSRETLFIVDKLLNILQELNPKIELGYKIHYIGLNIDGIANNFAHFRPKKNFTRADFVIERNEETTDMIEKSSLDIMPYRGGYRIRLKDKDIEKHHDLLKILFKKAMDERG